MDGWMDGERQGEDRKETIDEWRWMRAVTVRHKRGRGPDMEEGRRKAYLSVHAFRTAKVVQSEKREMKRPWLDARGCSWSHPPA